MVSAVYKPYKPRPGVCEPLAKRWEEACVRLRRELPVDHPDRSLQTAMIDEWNLDAIDTAIEHFKETQYAKTRAELAARYPWQERFEGEITSWQRRYETARLEIVKHQKTLRFLPRARMEMLADCGMLPADWDREFESIASELGKPLPTFASSEEAKAVADALMKPALFIEAREKQISSVVFFLNRPPGEQALEMCERLAGLLRQEREERRRLEAELNPEPVSVKNLRNGNHEPQRIASS